MKWKWILGGLGAVALLATAVFAGTVIGKHSGPKPTVNLTLSSGQTYVYSVGKDGSIWMSGDEGLELLKLQGGVVTLSIPAGWEAKVYASAGTISGPNGACNLGNPATCGGSEVLQPGVYVFTTGAANPSAGIKADVTSTK